MKINMNVYDAVIDELDVSCASDIISASNRYMNRVTANWYAWGET